MLSSCSIQQAAYPANTPFNSAMSRAPLVLGDLCPRVMGALKAGDSLERKQRLEVGYILDIRRPSFRQRKSSSGSLFRLVVRFSSTRSSPLRTAGADVSVVDPRGSYVLQDREMISGQNPFSDEAFLKLLLAALDGKKKRVGKSD
jgi:hypothetical protein